MTTSIETGKVLRNYTPPSLSHCPRKRRVDARTVTRVIQQEWKIQKEAEKLESLLKPGLRRVLVSWKRTIVMA